MYTQSFAISCLFLSTLDFQNGHLVDSLPCCPATSAYSCSLSLHPYSLILASLMTSAHSLQSCTLLLHPCMPALIRFARTLSSYCSLGVPTFLWSSIFVPDTILGSLYLSILITWPRGFIYGLDYCLLNRSSVLYYTLIHCSTMLSVFSALLIIYQATRSTAQGLVTDCQQLMTLVYV